MIFWFSAETRVPLARPAAEDPVEVLESPAVRPAVERPGGTLLAVGRQVPLAEGRGAVPVVLEDPRQRRAVAWKGRGIAGEPTGELADRTEPDGVVVPPSQQRRPRWRAERRDMEPVVAQPALGHARVVGRLDRPAEGARVAVARIVDEDQQHVRRPLGRRRMPDEVPVRLGTVEGPVGHPRERLPADREPTAIGFTHRSPPSSRACLAILRRLRRLDRLVRFIFREPESQFIPPMG